MTDPNFSAIRARLRYESLDDFIEGYAKFISAGGMFIPMTPSKLKPVGTTIRFQFLLQDGTTAMLGEGVVRQIQGADSDDNSPVGMLVKFSRLSRDSKQVVDRVLELKSGDAADEPAPAPFEQPEREPRPTPHAPLDAASSVEEPPMADEAATRDGSDPVTTEFSVDAEEADEQDDALDGLFLSPEDAEDEDAGFADASAVSAVSASDAFTDSEATAEADPIEESETANVSADDMDLSAFDDPSDPFEPADETPFQEPEPSFQQPEPVDETPGEAEQDEADKAVAAPLEEPVEQEDAADEPASSGASRELGRTEAGLQIMAFDDVSEDEAADFADFDFGGDEDEVDQMFEGIFGGGDSGDGGGLFGGGGDDEGDFFGGPDAGGEPAEDDFFGAAPQENEPQEDQRDEDIFAADGGEPLAVDEAARGAAEAGLDYEEDADPAEVASSVEDEAIDFELEDEQGFELIPEEKSEPAVEADSLLVDEADIADELADAEAADETFDLDDEVELQTGDALGLEEELEDDVEEEFEEEIEFGLEDDEEQFEDGFDEGEPLAVDAGDQQESSAVELGTSEILEEELALELEQDAELSDAESLDDEIEEELELDLTEELEEESASAPPRPGPPPPSPEPGEEAFDDLAAGAVDEEPEVLEAEEPDEQQPAPLAEESSSPNEELLSALGSIDGDEEDDFAMNLGSGAEPAPEPEPAPEAEAEEEDSLESLLANAQREIDAKREQEEKDEQGDILDDLLGSDDLPPPPGNEPVFDLNDDSGKKKKKGFISKLFGKD